MQAQGTTLRTATDDELAAMYDAGDIGYAALEAECDRRDQAAKRAVAYTSHPWAQSDAEWESAAYAQYEQAEEYCRGDDNMLSEAGRRTGRGPWPMLWQGSDETAYRLASDEMVTFWDYTSPRVPGPGEFRGAHQAERAAGYEQATEAAEMSTEAPAPARELPKVDPEILARWQANTAKIREEHEADMAASVGTVAVAPKTGTIIPSRSQPDPAALLRRVLEETGLLITDYVEVPSQAVAVAIVLWIAQAACRDSEGDPIWRALPRLLLTSAQNGSGKSTVGDLAAILLQCRAGRMSKVTPYGLTKVLGGLKETAIADDAQNVFRSDKAGAELLSVLINGYTKGATWVSGKSDGKVEPAWGQVIIIGKDELITKRRESLADLFARSVIARLHRATRYMPEVDEAAEDRARVLAQALTAVTGALQTELRQAARDLAGENTGQEIAEGDGGRTAQIWRPMLAVARVAGGHWPAAALQAARELSAASGDLMQADEALTALETASAALGTGERSFWGDDTTEATQ